LSASSVGPSASRSAGRSVRDAEFRTSGCGASGLAVQRQALRLRLATRSVYSSPSWGQSAVGCEGGRNPPERDRTSLVTDEFHTESLLLQPIAAPPESNSTRNLRRSRSTAGDVG